MLTEFVLGAVQVVMRKVTAVIFQLTLTLQTDTLGVTVSNILNHGAITPERINAPMKNGIAR
jgi:hypothetical protein